jgi:hypothetical protein
MTEPQPFHRRRKVKVTRIVVEHRGKILEGEEAQAHLLEASRSVQRNSPEIPDSSKTEPDDRSSMGRATKAIEARLVKAFSTIARQPIAVNSTAPRQPRKNGLGYFHDNVDSLARFIDAAAGRWESVNNSRPTSPSSKAIDDANKVIEWLLLIDEEPLRRLLVVGATSKRGDPKRRIPWERLRVSLPQWSDRTTKTMQRAYAKALAIILEKLTFEGVGRDQHSNR